MAIDISVIIIYALTFRSLDNALYGIVSMYVCSLAMDMVVYGSVNAKVAYIISDCHEAITAKLLEMGRGVTLLDGKGAYSGKEKQVILCAFGRGQMVAVKRLVREIDPEAFVIVCDAHEILGEGFNANTAGGL